MQCLIICVKQNAFISLIFWPEITGKNYWVKIKIAVFCFCQLPFYCPLNHWLPKLQHTQQLYSLLELNHLFIYKLSGRNIEEPLKWEKKWDPTLMIRRSYNLTAKISATLILSPCMKVYNFENTAEKIILYDLTENISI